MKDWEVDNELDYENLTPLFSLDIDWTDDLNIVFELDCDCGDSDCNYCV